MKQLSEPSKNLEMLHDAARRFGIDVVSSARVGRGERERFHQSIRETAARLDYCIVLGLRLSDQVLDTIAGAPNWTYYHHYRTVNFALDQAALFCAGECRRMGWHAFPIPASQVMDWEKLRGHLSHRELGGLAGIGWRGRNNLLVHPRYGSQVRYVSILTDLPLPERGIDLDASANCGHCRACVAVCPAGAIAMEPETFDLDKCTAQVRRFSQSEKLNALICGICVRACRGTSGAAAGAAGGCA
jgi:epoxyqueuosine reductase